MHEKKRLCICNLSPFVTLKTAICATATTTTSTLLLMLFSSQAYHFVPSHVRTLPVPVAGLALL